MSKGFLAAGLGVLLMLGAIAAAVLEPEDARLPSALAAGALLALGLFALLERDLVRRLLTGRQARMGSLAVAYTAAVLSALAALGFLAHRHAWRHDLTKDQRNSLSAETVDILSRIPKDGGPLELFGVALATDAGAQAEAQRLERRLELFGKASSRITARSVNAQMEPALVRELGVTRLPSVVVRWKPSDATEPRVRLSEEVDEKSIGRTIQDALLGTLPIVYVLQGHGELPLADQGPAGLVFWASELRATNHDVRELVLGAAGVPEDAALVIVPGPQADLLPSEIEALRAHAARGGRILLLLGPPAPDAADKAFPALAGWLDADWGLQAPAVLVADLDSIASAGDASVLVVPPAATRTHPIVKDLAKILLMPITRAVAVQALQPVGVTAETLLRSGRQSWGETNLEVSPAYDEGADQPGPLGLAAAVTRKPFPQEKEARLVVVGSPFMAANAQYGQAGNATFLRNCVDWLTGQEQALEARKDAGEDGTVVIPAKQGRVILLTSLLVPLIVLAAGVVTWAHRRRL